MASSIPQSEASDQSQSQYDDIGAKYTAVVKQLPAARIESSSLHAAVAPHIHGARVLDLACGTGYYSRLLLEWGASSVVGVDLSPAMVAAAERSRESLAPEIAQQLSFRVGDAALIGKLDSSGEGFDVVVGAWLLNYAGDENELAAMFSTISANLKGPNAVFVGIAAPPAAAADLDRYAAWMNDPVLDQRRREGIRVAQKYYQRNERMPEGCGGWRVEVVAFDEEGQEAVKFRNYHLPTEVFERAAKKGGMKGKLEWREVRMEEEIREQAIMDFGETFWKEYFEIIGPHFGLLVVEKGSDGSAGEKM